MPLPVQYVVARFIYVPAEGDEMQLIAYYVPVVNVSVPTQSQLNTFADQLSDTVGAALKTVLAADVDYKGVNCSLNNGGVIFSATSINNAGFGAIVGDSLPPNNAVVIRKRSDVPGRPGYGRWFVGGIAEGNTNDARLSGAAPGLYTDFAFALIAEQAWPVTAENFQARHLSRKNETMVPIVAVSVVNVIKRQSRRSLQRSI